MKQLKLAAPWVTFNKKMKALFDGDKDIVVGDIYESAATDYAFDIEVKSHKKFEALNRVLPKYREFGNVTLAIILYDEGSTLEVEDFQELFKAVFDGNENVQDIQKRADQTGTEFMFVRFKPKVIQFYNDDTSDFNGLWSGLAMDIAKDAFDQYDGVSFCTAPVDED